MTRSQRCPSCGAPALPMPACPECGTAYPSAPPEPDGSRWTGEADEQRHERLLRLAAPPVALALGLLVARTGLLASLVRIVDTMWLHELGHAVTAWLSGFAAFPGPWRTVVGEQRSPVLALLVAATLLALGAWAWRRDRRPLAVAAGAVLALQLVLTVGVRPHAALGLVLFGGDAGALVLGTALFVAFFARRGSHLQVSWLRWGFLVLGALGFADVFTLWWQARRDPSVIPFGEIEGVGHSDPSRLVDEHGWSVPALVSRYVALGVACLIVMGVFYALGARRGAAERRAET